MAFSPKTWQDNPSGGTPLTAAELNRIEQGIAAAEEKVLRGAAVAGQVPVLQSDGTLAFGAAGGYPATFANAVRQSTPVSLAGTAFTTVSLPTKGADPSNLFDTATSLYTVPSTGTYLIVASIRLGDGSGQAGASFGLGVHAASTDHPSFYWTGVPGVARRALPYSRIDQFTEGDKLRLYYYYDSGTAGNINSASLSVIRIA